MAASVHPIISKRVGEGGHAGHSDVKRVQQLLARAGFLPKYHINGVWGKAGSPTAKAWDDYQSYKGWTREPYLDPLDAQDRLAYLATDAGAILWTPHYLKSLSAVTKLMDMIIETEIPYGWGSKYGEGTRMVYGFQGRPWAMIFLEGGYFDVEAKDARSFNCCSFVNVLLSVWRQGNIHSAPYDPNQHVGGDGLQLGTRYGMPEVKNSKGTNVFDSLDELQGTIQPGRIYHMALCRDKTGSFTKHDVAVIDNTVYQSNIPGTSPNGSGVYAKPLDAQWKSMKVKRVRLFGPGPF